MGRNGKKIANFAKVFKIKVQYFDAKNKKIKKYRKINNFKHFLSTSDVVVITASLNATTNNLINAKTLKYFKKNSYLINTSRGEIVCEKSLIKALKTKKNLRCRYRCDKK